MSRALVSPASVPVLEHGLTRHIEVEPGLTLLQMIEQAFPGLPDEDHEQVRVLLVAHDDIAVVHPDYWHCTRPKAHVRVILRLVPTGDNGLRSVLTVVVSVAALALGQFWAAALIPTAGVTQTLVGGLITAGLTVAGTLLINALIPIQQPGSPDGAGQSYSIQGWRNTARPNEPVPFVLGRHRMAPPFAAPPYSTIIGNEQYVTALFTFGYGPLDISDIRIGETPISEFSGVEMELREGRDGDEPVAIYPQQVLERNEGVELTRRADDGSGIQKIVRTSARNSTEFALIFFFPAGLIRFRDDGSSKSNGVGVTIRQRPVGATTWQDVVQLGFSEKTATPFFRQYRWAFPSRGQWEVELQANRRSNESTNRAQRIDLVASQSMRSEYALNTDKPLALLGIRVRATSQLNGALDSVNAIVSRYAEDWDGAAWSEGLSRNPATAYRAALQSPQNPFPVPDDEIDLDQLSEWHEWCASKGLKYDYMHQEPQSLREQLMAICAAGRATPRHDGLRWGVVVDRPDGLVVDHISPRNSRDFRWRRTYLRPPHAFRVQFRDETNGWELAERIVPWPGHEGDITLTEDLPLVGKTDPDEIWIETRRRQHELRYRLDAFSAVQDGGARVATRGDKVMAAFDVLDRTLSAGRIVSAEGLAIHLDEEVEMDDGQDYALRLRTYADEDDAIGASIVVPLITRPGRSRLVLARDPFDPPRLGEVAHFGLLGSESMAMRLRGIEAGDNFSQVVHMVADAPEIDTLTDAEVPEQWTGYVGEQIFVDVGAPAVPEVAEISEEYDGNVYSGGSLMAEFSLLVRLAPGGAGTLPSRYELDYRLSGASGWTTVSAPSTTAGQLVGPFDIGNTVQLRGRALSADGTPSDYFDVVDVQIGADAGAAPAALDGNTISVTGGLGHAAVAFAVSDPATASVQIYRVPSGAALDPDLHAVGGLVPVSAGGSYSVVDGDATRVDLALNGGFGSAADWTEGTGWTIGSGVAAHAGGASGRLSQSTAALTGVQRVSATISGRTAGQVTPVLTGTDEVTGTALAANGTFAVSLDAGSAAAAPDGFGFDADAAFDGSIDNVIRYLETAACIDNGAYDYILVPHSGANVPGPLSARFMAQVI